MTTTPKSLRSKGIRGILCLLIVALPFCLPVPEGLTQGAWVYLGIAASVFLGMILEPVPAPLVALIGVGTLGILRLGPEGSLPTSSFFGLPIGALPADAAMKWVLSGFSSPVVWSLLTLFVLGKAWEKTGLIRKIGWFFLRFFGRTSLGLGYAVALLDGLLAPFIPLASVRSGGIIYPLVMSLPPLAHDRRGHEPRKLGAYLVWVAFASSCVTSSLFLTAYLPNRLSLQLVPELNQDWTYWLMASAPAGILLLIATPLITYWLYPPMLKVLDRPFDIDAATRSRPTHRLRESMLALVTVGALGLWMEGTKLGINGTSVALGLLCVLLAGRFVDWKDFLEQRQAWKMLLWLGALIPLTEGLITMNIVGWCMAQSTNSFDMMPSTLIILGLGVLFFMSQYLVVGGVAQAVVILPLFLDAGLSDLVGASEMRVLALWLPLLLGFMGVLTPYATGQGQIWLASGYVKPGEFWFLGLLFGCIYLAVQVCVTLPWIILSGLFS